MLYCLRLQGARGVSAFVPVPSADLSAQPSERRIRVDLCQCRISRARWCQMQRLLKWTPQQIRWRRYSFQVWKQKMCCESGSVDAKTGTRLRDEKESCQRIRNSFCLKNSGWKKTFKKQLVNLTTPVTTSFIFFQFFEFVTCFQPLGWGPISAALSKCPWHLRRDVEMWTIQKPFSVHAAMPGDSSEMTCRNSHS